MQNDVMKEYLIITFVVIELLSMMFNFYFVSIDVNGAEYRFNFSVVFFCIGFFIVDIVADYFSPKEANRFIFYKLFSQTLFLILGNLAISIYSLENSQIDHILSKSPWVMLAGLVATYAGFYVMSCLMSYMKVGVYQGTSVFKRYLYSTLPGELLFSLVFTFLCFYQLNSTDELINIFITSSVVKLFLSFIFALIMSLMVKLKLFREARAYLISGQI